MYAVRRAGAVVAAANIKFPPPGLANVGVVTAHEHRGRGYATRVVSFAVTDALRDAQVVQYRARRSNGPSIAIAQRLGFAFYGDNIAVRLADVRRARSRP